MQLESSVEDDDPLNAEKVLEQAMRFHQQRRNAKRFASSIYQTTPKPTPSIISQSSTSSKESGKQASPGQAFASPSFRSSTLPPARPNPPNLSIASFDVLIRELEQEEEEERKRKRPDTPESPELEQQERTPPAPPSAIGLGIAVPTPPPSATSTTPLNAEDGPAIPRPRARRPNPLNEAKRRSTGSLLFHTPLTPNFTRAAFDKENSFTFFTGIDKRATPQRVSVASFGSEHTDSRRNSTHELQFNFVEWSTSGCGVVEAVRRGEYAGLGMADRGFGALSGEMVERRRGIVNGYNFGRRGSVF
jgi:hypothetical protein